jgi:transposase
LVRQDINRAVNQSLADHPDARIVYEDLSVASMRFKARAMNAYLYASNLGHIPERLAWATTKRGMAAHTVKAAYSSQECHRCHSVDRANRPDQSTFVCIRCGYRDHADHNAAQNLADRLEDAELAACQNKSGVKAVLLQRHDAWKKQQRAFVVCPPVQLSLWENSEASTDVG